MELYFGDQLSKESEKISNNQKALMAQTLQQELKRVKEKESKSQLKQLQQGQYMIDKGNGIYMAPANDVIL